MLLLPWLRSIPPTIILPLLLAASTPVTAQDESTNNHVSPTSSAPPDPSPYPTATIFLPGSLHELPGGGQNLAASIITADVNQTAFAVGCMYAPVNASTTGPSACKLQSSITVTGGESTLIYTYNPIVTTDNGMPGTSDNPPTASNNPGATINCNMSGGTRATAATCTGSSQIAGLGRVGSSTTLASTQIDYATLTVTAGRAMLEQASEAARSGDGGSANGDSDGSESSAGAAAAVRAGAGSRWGVLACCGVAVGFGGLGVLVL